MNGKEKSKLSEISFTLGEMHADIKTMKKNQSTLFTKLNLNENRSLTNEKDIKNIYKSAGIIGGVVSFFVGIILWLLNKVVK